MFTGIIEGVGTVKKIDQEMDNLHFWIESPFTSELKIDQSVAHNGVCLTVVAIEENRYQVTAVKETLTKTNLGELQENSVVNLERCLQFNGRIDGHIVQGHVDQVGRIESIKNEQGSFLVTIGYDEETSGNVTVEKGSICVNGISLTVVDSKVGAFSVAIIPYTWSFTNLHAAKVGDSVNLEFDILGKYIKRLLQK